MNFFKVKNDKLLPILINRTAIFFFIMCLFTIILYVAGTYQNFIDSTQLSLLNLYVILGFFLITASFFGIILEFMRMIREKKNRYLLRAGGYLLLFVFGVISILAVLFIIALSEGNSLGGIKDM